MGIVWGILILGLAIIVTVINFISMIFAFFKQSLKHKLLLIIDLYTFISGLILTSIGYFLYQFKDYNLPLCISDDIVMLHAPVSSQYGVVVIFLFLIGMIGYYAIQIKKLNLSPLMIVMMFSFIFIGIGVSITILIQLSKHLFEFMIVFLCFLPLNFIFCGITLMIKTVSNYVSNPENFDKEYNNKFMTFLSKILINGYGWTFGALILIIPVLIIIMLLLILFGQRPDSAILAFTQTSDWLLSQRISPPNLPPHDSHYLCTVSLKGHQKIVKPLRYGLRHGNKIIVNRQLLIANAFEELIQQCFPKLHKFIRRNYDKYGYPLSKHINSPWSADIVYILMKPLELFFLATLYLFSKDPETRICRQYTR